MLRSGVAYRKVWLGVERVMQKGCRREVSRWFVSGRSVIARKTITTINVPCLSKPSRQVGESLVEERVFKFQNKES